MVYRDKVLRNSEKQVTDFDGSTTEILSNCNEPERVHSYFNSKCPDVLLRVRMDSKEQNVPRGLFSLGARIGGGSGFFACEPKEP